MNANEQYEEFLLKFERLVNIAEGARTIFRDRKPIQLEIKTVELSNAIDRFKTSIDNCTIILVITMVVCTTVLVMMK